MYKINSKNLLQFETLKMQLQTEEGFSRVETF